MESIIVTLKAPGFEKDFELPCKVRLGELYPRLTSVLQETSAVRFGGVIGVILEKDGAGLLNPQATLQDYGICTGYVLDIVDEEKYDGFGER